MQELHNWIVLFQGIILLNLTHFVRISLYIIWVILKLFSDAISILFYNCVNHGMCLCHSELEVYLLLRVLSPDCAYV